MEKVVRLYCPILYTGFFLKYLQKIFDEHEKCGVKLPFQCDVWGLGVLEGPGNLLGEDVIFLCGSGNVYGHEVGVYCFLFPMKNVIFFKTRLYTKKK